MVNLDGCNTDTLVKGLDKSKLVLVDVTVKGKNGTFTRKQWKKASDVSNSDKVLKVQDEKKDKPAGNSDAQTGKQRLVGLLSSGHSRNSLIEFAKKNGVTWKESDHEGVNWMRASMAIQKHMENHPDTWKTLQGGTQPSNQPQSQPANDSKSSPDASVNTSDVQDLVKKLGSKEETLKALKAKGIAWKENSHEGVNWMRAMQALKKAMSENSNLPNELLDTKDKQATQKQDTQKQVQQLQDLVSQIQKPTAQQVAQQSQNADFLKGITTDTKSKYEKDHFGSVITSASPESLRNYRTLGMCAGDKESEAYLSRLYQRYSAAIQGQGTSPKYDPNVDSDPLRNKLQGVVNKQVVGVVKSSLKNIRKRTSQFTVQQKLLEPWVDPNAPLTDEQKEYIKGKSPLYGLYGSEPYYPGDKRKECQLEQDGSHSLMHKVLDKFKQSSEYGQLADEYDEILTEYEQLTLNCPILQTFTNGNNFEPVGTPAYDIENDGIRHIIEAIEKIKHSNTILEDKLSDYQPGGRLEKSPDAAQRIKFLSQSIDKNDEEIQRLEDAKDDLDGNDLRKAAKLRKQLFDPKFTDLNANLYHFKMMAAQLSFQYEIKKDFVSEYPILSKDNLDKLDAADEDSLTNLSLYAGMFKPSLTKDGKSAKDALMDKYSERQAFLDAYGGVTSVQGASQYAEDNEIKCQISKADPKKAQSIIDGIAADWDKKNHGRMKYRISGVYEVSGLAVEKEFQQIKKKNSKYAGKTAGGKDCGSDMFYHGTGSMATSLILGHSGEFRIVNAKVGRMLGDGIYLADKSSKSAQYIGDSGYSRSGIQGSLMVVEASLGDTKTSIGYDGKTTYDSIFAGKDRGLLNSEWCVRDPHAVIPRYLVEMEIL